MHASEMHFTGNYAPQNVDKHVMSSVRSMEQPLLPMHRSNLLEGRPQSAHCQQGSHGSQQRRAGQPSPLAIVPEVHNAGSLRCADHILKHALRREHGSQLREAGHRPRGTGRLCCDGRLRLARATDCLQSTPCVLAYPSYQPHNTAKRISHQISW